MTLGTERIRTLDDIRAFLVGSDGADIIPHDRKAAYKFIERTLVRFRYHFGLSRAGKGLVRRYLAKVTGYSGAADQRVPARPPSPLLNHHRSCLFAVEVEGENGRRRRKYPQELVMTLYEKLRSLDGAEGFLKPGITFDKLDAIANAATSLEAGQEVQRARKALFQLITKALNPAA